MSTEIITLFESEGGEFISPPSLFVEKLEKINTVLFDWDGVFNNGTKREKDGSIFSEVDAMGTNLLRYGLWRRNGNVPVTAVMSGENNPPALHLAKRENFHAIYSGAKNKAKAFAEFCNDYQCKPEQVLFFCDDVLDLDVARQCGVRIMVGRSSNIMLKKFVKENGLADYITGNDGDRYAVREGAELILGLLGQFNEVVKNRMEFSNNFSSYMAERKKIETKHIEI